MGVGWATRDNVATDWQQPHQPSKEPAKTSVRKRLRKDCLTPCGPRPAVYGVDDGWWVCVRVNKGVVVVVVVSYCRVCQGGLG